MDSRLIEKYNIPGPRYTSYPTVPCWDESTFNSDAWVRHLRRAFSATNATAGVSLYVHLPYCESLCTFCGCNKRITRNHGVELPYIEALLREWNLYCDLLIEKPRLREIHFGGGTPSFFSPENLRKLLAGLFARAERPARVDYGWEGHPNNTTREHLQTLFDFGFRRVSFGVQDYDPVVQRAIHRHQPFENVRNVTTWSREMGYTSVAHDLVFGLPFQTPDSILQTVEKTVSLRPDRIAFYSYAHVPWLKGNGQRGFLDDDLPSGEQKRKLYELGRELLESAGYAEIGMDHFALPGEALHRAMLDGTLHRNFMGYTTTQTSVLIGLGASSIGEVGTAFAQNEKDLDAYLSRVAAGELPLRRGHVLDAEDRFIRQHILNVMCRFETRWNLNDWTPEQWDDLVERLEGFRADGLIDFDETGLRVLDAGRPFLRNVCMAFDQRLLRSQRRERLFSATV